MGCLFLILGFAGAIGGVGNYINSYGQGIIDSTAASGEKKTAVKPAASQKSLPAAKTVSALAPSKAVASSTPKPSTPKPLNQQPSKPPPPAPNRNLPSKKPSPQFPQKPAGATSLTKISASAADRTADGKIRISPSSRPQPVRPPGGGVGKGPVKSVQANGGPKPLPRIAAGKGDRTADGKIRISQASRPRPVVSAR